MQGILKTVSLTGWGHHMPENDMLTLSIKVKVDLRKVRELVLAIVLLLTH